jgi:hypothetical protein
LAPERILPRTGGTSISLATMIDPPYSRLAASKMPRRAQTIPVGTPKKHPVNVRLLSSNHLGFALDDSTFL